MSENFRQLDTTWNAFRDPEYRRAYVSAHIGDTLALQILAMRRNMGWTQKQLGDKIGIPQSSISKLENSCESVNLSTLKKVADAFDVALSVKFIPFSFLAREANGTDFGTPVRSFSQDNWAVAAAPPTISRTVAANMYSARPRRWTVSASQNHPKEIRAATDA